ncbi:hypothetical protein SAMN05216337_1001158 [Bradyrhizobium brasilense]|uniref:Uncharacterized protein n=1 Tax=Bradyrhizobium brasilense TaxID=1419277 RepID=A0A1G6IJQ3_9BRAD|nr:hypothetical protein [Bradyrhizobium brasilense]SDC06225.1 hypothetical protein SAMN05216337_1001158 [Bradyrhizobium brasilense]
MSDNVTTPLASGTKFKTHDFGANGHGRADVLFDTNEEEILGKRTDAKSSSTDTTSVGLVALFKQISFSIQAVATFLAAAATSIGKAEDSASANADVGVPAMAIQKSSPADTAGTDGDYAMLQMSGGRLWTSAVVPAGATSIAKAEDVASADADVGVPAMAIQKASPADTAGTDGDYAMLQMSSGRLWVDASGKTLTVGAHTTYAMQETSAISNAGASLTPKFAKISASASGANTVIASVSGKKIRVLEWNVLPHDAVNIKWQSHTAGDITGLLELAAKGNGIARPFNPVGYFETTAGEALDLNLSSAVAVGGSLVYVEV